MKNKMLVLLVVVFIGLIGSGSRLAWAWDGSVNGTIDTFEGTGAGGQAFRVWLDGSPPLCGNDNKWAYLNDADANYKVNVALLLAAQAQNRSVDLFSNRDGYGFCQIGHIMVH